MSGWQVFVEVAGRPPFEVRPGESIIGRSRLAQVHIPESTVSRQHARLLTSPLGEVTVEDLGSSNGTYVNNDKVEGRRRLADGDRIHVGDAELRVRIVAPVAPSEATVRMTLPPMSGPPPAQPLPPAAAPPAAPAFTRPPAAPQPPLPPRPLTAPPPVAPPLPPQPLAPPPASYATVAAPPARAFDPPLRAEPPRAPAPPPPAAAPPPAPAPTWQAPRRGPELPSVTGIDRIPIPEPSPEVIRASKLARATPAGFGVRFAAALIDAALITFLAIPLWIVASFAVRQNPLVATFAVPAIFGLLSLVYPIVFWATRGATPGKLFLRLRIIGPRSGPDDGIGWSTSIVRFLGYVVSTALLGVGFLLVLFTSQKQGLHDLIAGTRVVRLR